MKELQERPPGRSVPVVFEEKTRVSVAGPEGTEKRSGKSCVPRHLGGFGMLSPLPWEVGDGDL